MKNTISLCMIVKDEERFIRQCLKSAQDFVDEIIIVDTGSTDKTKSICLEFTDKVYDYTWQNNFAQARNYALKKASSAWILILDADERVTTKHVQKIKANLFQTKANQLLLPITIYYGESFPVDKNKYYAYYQPRIFRNHIGFQYKKRIHETLYLSHSTSEISREKLSLPIAHYGYIKSLVQQKQKSNRNIQLLELEQEHHPTNPWNKYHLGSEYYNLQHYSLAFDYVNEAIYQSLMLNIKPNALFYRLKYAILIDTNSIDNALSGIEKAITLYPDYVDLQFYKGYILYMLEKYEEALLAFQHCLTLNENHPNYLILKGTGSFLAEEYIENCQTKRMKTNTHPKKILYIGWIGLGNVGDELMYDLFQEHASHTFPPPIVDFVNYEEKFLKNINIHYFDVIILGGGSIFSSADHAIEPYIISFLYKAIEANKQVIVWGTGMDSLNKNDMQRLERNKRPLAIVSAELQKQIKYVSENAAYFGVRGPLTYEFFRQIGLSDKVQISGDAAFLMGPIHQTTRNKTIGVNWGTTYNALYGGNEAQVEAQLLSSLQTFLEKGYKIYLYVLWEADIVPSKRLYNKLNNPENVTLDDAIYNYKDLLSILSTFTFTINFKMHASYLSLAAQTPFIALAYRFKVYDFAKSIQMERFLIETDSQTIENDIIHLATEINQHYESIQEKMLHTQEDYAKKLKVPFESNFLN